MDVVLGPSSLSYRVVGGMLDLWVFAGPTPAAVLEQYTRVVGRPALPPYWSLGFHQCRWGYENVSVLHDVVDGYRDADIPLEVLISDIDAMDGKRVFTLDPVHYPLSEMQAFVEKLHGNGQKWIPIIDPGIKIDSEYTAYTQGLEQDVFIKDVTGEPYVGSVWPGPVHFPDFLAPKGVRYWIAQIATFFKMIAFDGYVLWWWCGVVELLMDVLLMENDVIVCACIMCTRTNMCQHSHKYLSASTHIVTSSPHPTQQTQAMD